MSTEKTEATYNTMDFYIGLGLAISSSVFIGSSFIIKKKALLRLQRYGLCASAGGFGYLKDWLWWTGLSSMAVGEAANFAAYAFAPASLVTPLGALSVLVSAVLASKYLDERLNLLGKIGCFLCILGSTVMVIHCPKAEEISDLNELFNKTKEPRFLIYILIVMILSLSIIFHIGPIYGERNVMVYICLCSLIGSLTVMFCKGLGLALKETFTGRANAFADWYTWIFIFGVILCISVQMNYLNKSLDLFDTTVVTPIYYVLFTTLVIVASAILYREWESMNAQDILGSICGFLTVITAIFLLNGFKDVDLHYGNVGRILRPKREVVANYNMRWNMRDDERSLSPITATRLDSNIERNYGTPGITRTI